MDRHTAVWHRKPVPLFEVTMGRLALFYRTDGLGLSVTYASVRHPHRYARRLRAVHNSV